MEAEKKPWEEYQEQQKPWDEYAEKEPQQIEGTETPTFALSAEKNVPKDIAKGTLSGLEELPTGATIALSKLLAPLTKQEALNKENIKPKFQEAAKVFDIPILNKLINNIGYEPKTWQGQVGKIGSEIAPYFLAPNISTAKNAQLPEKLMSVLKTGGQAAGIEGIRAESEGKNPIQSALIAALTGMGLHSAQQIIPTIGTLS